ncbi:MAG: hypothetical protein ABI836_13100 [Gemmatimonadota bacterium]
MAILWLPVVIAQRGGPPPDVSSAVPPPAPGPGPAVQVTPPDSSISITEHAAGYVATYFVKNIGTVNSTYTMTCVVVGQLSCISVSPAQATLSPNQQVDVDITYGTGNQSLPKFNKLKLTATGGGTATGQYSVNIGTSIIQLAATGTLTSTLLTVRRRQPLLIARFMLPSGLQPIRRTLFCGGGQAA